jgi:hypothetical protein
MTLRELLTIADTQVVIRYPSDSGEFYADIDNGELKDCTSSPILGSCCAYGDTPDMAVARLVVGLRGNILVINAMTEKRRQFKVPKTLSHEYVSEETV